VCKCGEFSAFSLYHGLCSTRTIVAPRKSGKGLRAGTPSPRSTDAVGGDGAAGLDAARGVTNAAVGADGSELVDDATPTAAATTAERDKKFFFPKKK
jgi:hypothetical protein